MEENEEIERLRTDLKEIRDRYTDTEHPPLKNMSTVIDSLILCTYMPEHLQGLYDLVNKHYMDLLGGGN